MSSKVRVYYICCSLFVHVDSRFVLKDHQIGQAEMSFSYLQPTHLSIFFPHFTVCGYHDVMIATCSVLFSSLPS